VLIPILVASVLTGGLGFAIGLTGRWAVVSQAPMMITAILIYAATLFFLGRSGIATIRGLEQRAHIDPLTGLPNRHALYEDVQFLSRGDDEVALAMIDLDSFKQVNDHYGHGVGD
jgi:GGDEF domain-containing protein